MSITINEVRNVIMLGNGDIDCEFNHPKYGWIPYTISDNDPDHTIDNNALKTLIAELDNLE